MGEIQPVFMRKSFDHNTKKKKQQDRQKRNTGTEFRWKLFVFVFVFFFQGCWFVALYCIVNIYRRCLLLNCDR